MGNALGTPPARPSSLPKSPAANGEEGSFKRRTFTVSELASFDGVQDEAIYIAVRGNVYDVSAAREMYGPEGELRACAGKDVSRALALDLREKEDIETFDLTDLTDEQREALDAREREFRDDHKYPDVGRVIVPQDISREDLRHYNGIDDPRGTVLLAVDGTIYDVTMNGLAFYGPDGLYEQFAGRDASRALACMSFDTECLDEPSLDGLTSEQREVLAEWTERFQQKYAVIGRLIE